MKLKRVSDWGYIKYANTADQFVVLIVGMVFKVKWPDGSCESCELSSMPHTENVSDMGHHYTVDSFVFGFKRLHHGIGIWIPIEDVDIEY